jgi:hypothetical protein
MVDGLGRRVSSVQIRVPSMLHLVLKAPVRLTKVESEPFCIFVCIEQD